jgi:mannose-6-phosphate isomerase-like protein (cupin superfamily)
MADRCRLPLSFDASRLREDLDRLSPEDWIDHFVPDNYEGRWRVAPLRGPADAVHPIQMIYPNPGCESFAGTPLLARCPCFEEVLDAFDCDLEAVRLMSLGPGSKIREHRDHELSVEEGAVRLHVPVTTGPGVRFYLNGEPVPMRPGECWYLRLSDPHRVDNDGPGERVHLVIDARTNDWLRRMLATGDRGQAAG